MRVLIAHGSSEIAKSLRPLMEAVPAVELLSPTSDAYATLDSIRAHDPELLIIDARIPGAVETDLLQIIHEEKPRTTKVILTQLTFPEFRARMEVWQDFISLDTPRMSLPFSGLDAEGKQNGGVWIKFSCGELGFLRPQHGEIFDVVATAL
jgi:hypothetical protein